MFGKDIGVDRHTWNDWFGLAGVVISYFLYPKKWGEEAPEKQRELEGLIREKHRELFEKKLEHAGIYFGIVRPYSDRLRMSGIDLDSLTLEGEERINDEREKEGKQRLNWERVRRLDELAKQCNESLRDTIYNNQPFEWKKLYEACKEANKTIYGEGPAEEFFEGLVIED